MLWERRMGSQTGERLEGSQAEGMGNRNYEHRMTAAERGNTWAGEEKSGGRRLEVPQKECLKVSGKEHIE